MKYLDFFLPYDFYPAVFILCLGGIIAYVRGLYRSPVKPGVGHIIAFVTGVLLIYTVMQTRFDYWSQHMFFIHRLQHLVLHHLGAFLVALSNPGYVLAAGLPEAFQRPLGTFWNHPLTQRCYAIIQQPLIAAILFVGLIYFWLIPDIHFYAMLSRPLYKLMNWSMAIDGLLFWWMILRIRPESTRINQFYAWRILLLFLIVLPQIVIGAYIALCDKPLYSIYAVCGRIWPISPTVDQQVGGLITWIPAAMMSLFGMLAVLYQWLHSDKHNDEQLTENKHVVSITT